MKPFLPFFFIPFLCLSCVTTKVTSPDGTITEVSAFDKDSLLIGAQVANNIIDKTSGK